MKLERHDRPRDSQGKHLPLHSLKMPPRRYPCTKVHWRGGRGQNYQKRRKSWFAWLLFRQLFLYPIFTRSPHGRARQVRPLSRFSDSARCVTNPREVKSNDPFSAKAFGDAACGLASEPASEGKASDR